MSNIKDQLKKADNTLSSYRLSEKEQNICNGLNEFAPETAAFFRSGLNIYYSNIETRSYFLAHVAREVEAGLRDILCPKSTVEKCETCGSNKRNTNHRESILKSLGLIEGTTLSEKWHKVAKEFHKYAHRHGAWKTPRETTAFDKLWLDFVDILDVLVGNYYNITDRIETILLHNIPSEGIIGSLETLLKKEANKIYFFNRLYQEGWLEPLFRASYFAGKNNPEPIINEKNNSVKYPQWNELNYIRNIVYKLSKIPNADYSLLLVIIDGICKFRKKDGLRICNSNTDAIMMSIIAHLPSNLIEDKHYNYIQEGVKLNTSQFTGNDFNRFFIERFVKENDKVNLLKCLQISLSYKIIDSVYSEKYKSSFESYFLYELQKEYISKVIEICGIDGFNIAINVLDEIDDLLWHSLATIEDHYQNGQDLDNYQHQLIRIIRSFLLQLPISSDFIDIIKLFINKEAYIYKRLVYYVINNRYSDLSSIFWDITFNPIKELYKDHELFELFKSHSLEFTEEQLNIILSWINELDDYWTHADKQHSSSEKKMWLMSLLETKHSDVLSAYDIQCKHCPSEIEHPGFGGWMTSVFGDISPISLEDIQNKSLNAIITYYCEFKTQAFERHDITSPTIEGLDSIIKSDIISNIDKYIYKIDSIVDVSSGFQRIWINGLDMYCYNNKNYINSKEVYDVINKIISNENFITKYKSNKNINKSRYFAQNCLSLINYGLDYHNKMFDLDMLNCIKEIIININSIHDYTQIENDYTDISSKYINCETGYLYQCIINYIVVSAHQNKKTKKNRWDIELKKELDSLLQKYDNNPLFYYALGKETNQLYWIDSDWYFNILENMNAETNIENWKSFIIGYHLNNGVTEIFEILNIQGHYQSILDNRDLFNPALRKKVIHHICIAYHSEIIKFEISDFLIQSILSARNIEDYENIINFYAINTEYENLSNKVRELWRCLFELNIECDNELAKFFIGKSYKWIGYFDEIDAELKIWLMASAKYLSQSDQSNFIRKIEKYLDVNTRDSGEIILEMVKNKLRINYLLDLPKIVEYLFTNKQSDIANNICIECANKHCMILKEVYKKYNS